MNDKMKQAKAAYVRLKNAYEAGCNEHAEANVEFVDAFIEAAFELAELDIVDLFGDDTSLNAAATPAKGKIVTAVKED